MNRYKYRDFKQDKVIFECVASDILDADAQLKKATGITAFTSPHIGCSVEFTHKPNTSLLGRLKRLIPGFAS